MFKKFGVVTVGVTAGLLAAAPLASAHESHESHDDSSSTTTSSSDCNLTGGGAGAEANSAGTLAGNLVGQTPVGGSVIGNINCSEVLNGNLSDNLNGNSVEIGL